MRADTPVIDNVDQTLEHRVAKVLVICYEFVAEKQEPKDRINVDDNQSQECLLSCELERLRCKWKNITVKRIALPLSVTDFITYLRRKRCEWEGYIGYPYLLEQFASGYDIEEMERIEERRHHQPQYSTHQIRHAVQMAMPQPYIGSQYIKLRFGQPLPFVHTVGSSSLLCVCVCVCVCVVCARGSLPISHSNYATPFAPGVSLVLDRAQTGSTKTPRFGRIPAGTTGTRYTSWPQGYQGISHRHDRLRREAQHRTVSSASWWGWRAWRRRSWRRSPSRSASWSIRTWIASRDAPSRIWESPSSWKISQSWLHDCCLPYYSLMGRKGEW